MVTFSLLCARKGSRSRTFFSTCGVIILSWPSAGCTLFARKTCDVTTRRGGFSAPSYFAYRLFPKGALLCYRLPVSLVRSHILIGTYTAEEALTVTSLVAWALFHPHRANVDIEPASSRVPHVVQVDVMPSYKDQIPADSFRLSLMIVPEEDDDNGSNFAFQEPDQVLVSQAATMQGDVLSFQPAPVPHDIYVVLLSCKRATLCSPGGIPAVERLIFSLCMQPHFPKRRCSLP